MAAALLLSAVVMQKSFAHSWPSSVKSAPCSRCCHNGPLCNIIAQRHRIQGDAHDASSKITSRRDAIALSLQAAFLSVLSSNAQATACGLERAEGFDHVQFKNELDMKVLVDVSSVPKLILGKLAGIVLAYQGGQRGTGSSLGFLGCLVFGLLFLKENRMKAANNAALEDVQIQIKQAETELCSQTRSSVTYKLEEFQLGNGNGKDTSRNQSSQRQLVNAKLGIVEKGKQLGVKKDVSELLKKLATRLTASVEEIEKDRIFLSEHVDKKLNVRHELEAELQSVVADLTCKANKSSSLKASVENQEEANTEMVEKLARVESSLRESNKHAFDAEEKVASLRNALVMTDVTMDSLVKELRFTGTRNETLEAESNELFACLQSEQAAFARHLAEQKELLNLRGHEVHAGSTELSRKQDELERNWRFANQLKNQRDELMRAISEKRIMLDNLKEVQDSNQERLRTDQNELATLQEQLLHEKAHSTALELDLKSNGALRLLSKVSLELESQIDTQKDMTERLGTELQIAHQALTESKAEISTLQDKMQSLLSSQVQLQREIARLSEERQAVSQALKKEKRAAAYAKKQLALSQEIITEESRVMEELRNELEKEKRLTEDSKEQILAKASELERATETALQLTDHAFQSSALSVLNEEQGLQVNLGGSDECTSVSKPLRRRNINKKTTLKMQKSPRKNNITAFPVLTEVRRQLLMATRISFPTSAMEQI